MGLCNLVKLDLSDNSLETLPADIATLNQLEWYFRPVITSLL